MWVKHGDKHYHRVCFQVMKNEELEAMLMINFMYRTA